MRVYNGLAPKLYDRYDFKNKELCVSNHIRYMLSRTQSMFRYTGLPDSIPARDLELMLQVNGNVAITEHGGQLYALTGGLGGEPNPYYLPTLYIVSNPALEWSATLTIGEDCVVIKNDSMYMGLMPMYRRYATALTENELTMQMVTINSRQAAVISADDDRTLKSAEKYLKDLEDGKNGVVGANAFFDGIRVQPYGATAYTQALIPLIEHEQYLKASWYNELGLNANWNSKREAIGSNESALNNDMLLPLVDDMLKNRREGLRQVNDKYGTSISVELASSWEDNQEELDAEQEIIEDAAQDTPMGEEEDMTDGNDKA